MTMQAQGDPVTPLIEVDEVTKSFGAVQALRGVDFNLMPGEVTLCLARTARENRR